MEKYGQAVPRQCKLDYNHRGESIKLVDRARLKLEQFYVAFIILFVGYVLALIQFIREGFISRGHSDKKVFSAFVNRRTEIEIL